MLCFINSVTIKIVLVTALLCVLIPMSVLNKSKTKSVGSEDLMKTVMSVENKVSEQITRLTAGQLDKSTRRGLASKS